MNSCSDNRIWEQSLDLHTSLLKLAREKYKQVDAGFWQITGGVNWFWLGWT